MNEIILHIDFLLHTHDCVIVPELGGFVVNTTGIEKNGLWGLNAPTLELLFNNKLTYNDGLLAESLMRTNNVPYEVAIKQIKDACKEIKIKLAKGDEVKLGNLGVIKTDNEHNVIFMSNKDYVRPQFFGLSNARLRPAALFFSTSNNDEYSIPVKYIMRYVSTAIAAAVLLFLVVLSFYNSNPKSQYAEIVSKPLVFGNHSSKVATSKQSLGETIVANNNLPTAKVNNTITQSQSLIKKYYIIVGVYEIREVAENRLSKLKNEGFHTASMIERPRRLDVYSASFSDRDEAQVYLLKFQADNPHYHDSWILKR